MSSTNIVYAERAFYWLEKAMYVTRINKQKQSYGG